MSAIALGFGAAVCWGFADFLGGLRTRRLTLALVLVVSQLCGLAAITVVVGAADLEIPSGSDVAPALIAGVCQLAGIAALYRALAIGTMSVISPVSASGAAALPVIVGVAAGERPGALQVVGMAAAFAGVALATRTAGGVADSGRSREALALSAVAALGFGGFFVGIDAAADSTDPLGALLIARLAAVAALVAVLVARTSSAWGHFLRSTRAGVDRLSGHRRQRLLCARHRDRPAERSRGARLALPRCHRRPRAGGPRRATGGCAGRGRGRRVDRGRTHRGGISSLNS